MLDAGLIGQRLATQYQKLLTGLFPKSKNRDV
jgi:hypothetical protein